MLRGHSGEDGQDEQQKESTVLIHILLFGQQQRRGLAPNRAAIQKSAVYYWAPIPLRLLPGSARVAATA